MYAPDAKEWQDAAAQLGALHEEMQRLTSAALGGAFSATLLGVSERELDVAVAVGDRLLAELGKRGLVVFPLGDAPECLPEGSPKQIERVHLERLCNRDEFSGHDLPLAPRRAGPRVLVVTRRLLDVPRVLPQ